LTGRFVPFGDRFSSDAIGGFAAETDMQFLSTRITMINNSPQNPGRFTLRQPGARKKKRQHEAGVNH